VRHRHTLRCHECQQEFLHIRPGRQYCSRTCANKASGASRRPAIDTLPATTVWSCGGGVESTALALLIARGELPKPDHTIMVDCGYEESRTWRHVREVIAPNLESVGVRLTVIPTSDYGSNALFNAQGYLAIPAYLRRPGGERPGKLPTHCNEPWKVKPGRRWMRVQGIKRCENWVGIAANEAERARPSRHAWVSHRYPLVELGLTREDCLRLVEEAGWPTPGKSACYLCPQRPDEDWSRLRVEQPADWAKAVRVDREIRDRDERLYLHRLCVPLEDAVG